MQANEQWKAIPGLEGRYEVSSLGRVKSLLRGGRILKPGKVGRGYLMVAPVFPGVGNKPMRVHRLVLLAFVGPCPAGMEACHNNDIADDNRVENLRWDTREANCADRLRLNPYHGEKHPLAKLTEEQALLIVNAPPNRGYRSLAKEFGIHRSTVREIRRGMWWKHLPRPQPV